MKMRKAQREDSFIIVDSTTKKFIVTITMVMVLKFGNHISIPGITQKIIIEDRSFANLKPYLKPLNPYSNSNSIPNLFSIGIGPSITASILMQLILSINPDLKKIQREEGEYGRRVINRYIRTLTLIIALFQSIFFILKFRANFNFYGFFEACCLLVTGSMIVSWISENITKNGIVNGSSLLVFLNIAENIPYLLYDSLKGLNLLKTLLLLVTLTITVTSIIFLQKTTQKIILKKSTISIVNPEKTNDTQNSFFPCKLNTSSVMPLVFVSYFLPILTNSISFIILKFNISIIFPPVLTKLAYYLIEFYLICFFSQNYSLIILNPKDISEEFRKAAIFIPGVRPGQETVTYLENLFQRQAFIGGVILAFNTILMNIVGSIIRLPIIDALSLSSQIIMIGIVIEGYEKIKTMRMTDLYTKYL